MPSRVVSFDVSYSTDAVQGSGQNSSVTGMQSGINVVVTDSRDSFVSGRSTEVKGGALLLLNAATSDRGTLPHELGHVLVRLATTLGLFRTFDTAGESNMLSQECFMLG